MEHTQATDQDRLHIAVQRSGDHIAKLSFSLPASAWPGAGLAGQTIDAAAHQLAQQARHSPVAHATALRLACAAALDAPAPDLETRLATERQLAAEAADAHLQRLLVDWPPRFGLEARYILYAEFRRRLLRPCSRETAFALGGDVLDLIARELLAGFFNQIRMPHGIGEFIDRVNAGGSLGAVITELLAYGSTTAPPAGYVPLLDTFSAETWAHTVGPWPSAAFIHRPTQAGQPAETGPIARHAASPLIRLLLDRGHRVSARLMAKAIDVGDSATRMRHPPSDEVPPLADAFPVAPGVGVARLKTARGVLLCWAAAQDGVVQDCAMIPPEAWNFHPDGPFSREAPCHCDGAADPAAIQLRLSVLALALDPSMDFVVEITDAHPKKPAARRKTA